VSVAGDFEVGLSRPRRRKDWQSAAPGRDGRVAAGKLGVDPTPGEIHVRAVRGIVRRANRDRLGHLAIQAGVVEARDGSVTGDLRHDAFRPALAASSVSPASIAASSAAM
jgi:hypothetical protein